MRYSFSREKENSAGCAYVQERLLKDQKEVVELWEKGARVYVCGSGSFVKEITHAAKEVVRERSKAGGEKFSEEALGTFFREQMAGRTATDVFG